MIKLFLALQFMFNGMGYLGSLSKMKRLLSGYIAGALHTWLCLRFFESSPSVSSSVLSFVSVDIVGDDFEFGIAGSFDVAVYFYIAHLLPPETNVAVLSKAARALKPGAVLVFVDPALAAQHRADERPPGGRDRALGPGAARLLSPALSPYGEALRARYEMLYDTLLGNAPNI